MALKKNIRNIFPLPKSWEQNENLRQFGVRINDAIRELFARKVGTVKINGIEVTVGSSDTVNLGHQTRARESAIVVTGKKYSSNLSKGDYIILRNSEVSGKNDGVYIMANNVSANTTITSSDLTAASGGGFNSLQRAALEKSETTASGKGITADFVKVGKICAFSISAGNVNAAVSVGTTILTAPSGYRPSSSQILYGQAGSTNPARFTLNTSGNLTCSSALANGNAVRLSGIYIIS